MASRHRRRRIEEDSVLLSYTDFSGNVTTQTYEVDVTGDGASYTYAREDILREVRGGVTYTYVHGPGIDSPLARERAGVLAYYHADGLGSVVAATDPAGAVASTRRYDAWGRLEVGAGEAGYAFTGREWDPETGLYYYRARYYDPTAERFVSEDPIGFAGGINFHAYVGNSPIDFTDPEGLAVFRYRRPEPPTGSTSIWDWWWYHFLNQQIDALYGPLGAATLAGPAAGVASGPAREAARIVYCDSQRAARRAAMRLAGIGKHGRREVLAPDNFRPGLLPKRGRAKPRVGYENPANEAKVYHDRYGHTYPDGTTMPPHWQVEMGGEITHFVYPHKGP